MAEEVVAKLTPVTKEQMQAAIEKKQAEPAKEQAVAATPVVTQPTVAEVKPAAEIKKEEKGTAAVSENGQVVEEKKPRKLKTFNPSEKSITPAEELPEPLKAKISEYEKTISELKSKIQTIDEDDGYQLLVELRKGGKDAIDLIEQSRGEDVSKLSDAQLYELQLRKAGVKDEKDIVDQDSDEPTIEEEMAKFKALPKLDRDKSIKEIRGQYDEANKTKAGDLLGKLKAKNQENEQVNNAEQTKQREQAIQTAKDWDSYCDSYVGQEHMGVVGTPQMAESLKNVLKDPRGVFLKTDGTLDINKFFEAAHFLLFKDFMLENLENQIGAEKYEQYKREVEITGGAKNSLIRAPQATQASDKPAVLKPVSSGHPSVRN